MEFAGTIGKRGFVRVYNVRGELVRTLHDGEFVADDAWLRERNAVEAERQFDGRRQFDRFEYFRHADAGSLPGRFQNQRIAEVLGRQHRV